MENGCLWQAKKHVRVNKHIYYRQITLGLAICDSMGLREDTDEVDAFSDAVPIQGRFRYIRSVQALFTLKTRAKDNQGKTYWIYPSEDVF